MTRLGLPLDPAEVDYVFLDVDGTIVHEDIHVLRTVCAHMARASGGGASADELGDKWAEKWFGLCDIANEADYAPCRDLLPRSLRATAEHFAMDYEIDDWIEAVVEYSRRSPLLHDARVFLERVSIPVCLLSNRDTEPLHQTLERAGVESSLIVTSEDARAYKPHPGMFRRALDLTDASPERVVHIGDSHHADVCGAARLGINTVWLNREGRDEPTEEGIRADRVVASLLELVPGG
ncbi:MAG: HAD-IA family hydrolase [Armatimonadia bacterium]|nr:HAD-IA family hydrolase [Armatimonadia bacterium]